MTELFVVHSSLQSEESVKSDMDSEINLIMSSTGADSFKLANEPVKISTFLDEYNDGLDGIIILTATGGTEEVLEAIINKTACPVMIYAVSRKNSLAASLEAYSFLKESNPVKLYVAEENDNDVKTIENFVQVCKAIRRLNSSRLALIGDPSDWLLSSRDIDSPGKFKTKFVKLSTDEIVEKVKSVPDSTTEKVFSKITSQYPNRSVEEPAIRDSGKVYSGMKEIISEHNIDALSIRCFDLLEHNYTACMGMSMCNDDGIISGCEGDIPATFTMMIASFLTGKPSWMANPAIINKTENEITFAHCTIPSKMLKDDSNSNLTTHMESGLSTANQGGLHETEVTILRINSEFNKLVATLGKIVESDMREPSLCRTQARIKINGNVKDWIENTPGNHQIIVYGNIIELLQDFCTFTETTLIKV